MYTTITFKSICNYWVQNVCVKQTIKIAISHDERQIINVVQFSLYLGYAIKIPNHDYLKNTCQFPLLTSTVLVTDSLTRCN